MQSFGRWLRQPPAICRRVEAGLRRSYTPAAPLSGVSLTSFKGLWEGPLQLKTIPTIPYNSLIDLIST